MNIRSGHYQNQHERKNKKSLLQKKRKLLEILCCRRNLVKGINAPGAVPLVRYSERS